MNVSYSVIGSLGSDEAFVLYTGEAERVPAPVASLSVPGMGATYLSRSILCFCFCCCVLAKQPSAKARAFVPNLREDQERNINLVHQNRDNSMK
eukprot:scaffold277601_cov19-Tisochrysis_lutea.AAC.1